MKAIEFTKELFKRMIVLALCAISALSLFACVPSGYAINMKKIKEEAISLINYFTDGKSLAELPVIEIDWSGREVISTNNIFVVRAAVYFGVGDGAADFLNTLTAEFNVRYDTLEKVQSAPTSLLCGIALLLNAMQTNPSNFSIYNLYSLAAFKNASLETMEVWDSIYAMPLMLEVMSKAAVPSDAIYTPEILIEKIFSRMNNGGFSYNDGDADIDTTAMVMCGVGEFYSRYELANYYEQWQTALDTILTFKNEDGTFKNMFSSSSSSSTALAYAAFAQFDSLSFNADAKAKDNVFLTDPMTKFKNSDGGYRASLEEGNSDAFSSKDVLYSYYCMDKSLQKVKRKSI